MTDYFACACALVREQFSNLATANGPSIVVTDGGHRGNDSSEPNPPSVLGKTEPDPLGSLLGTNYERFNSNTGISGLAKFHGDRLDVLAVTASRKNTGQFREFVRIAKQQFARIFIWEVWNPELEPVLRRYKFTPASELQLDGEQLTGFKWERPNPPYSLYPRDEMDRESDWFEAHDNAIFGDDDEI